jgi:hypothetical protein
MPNSLYMAARPAGGRSSWLLLVLVLRCAVVPVCGQWTVPAPIVLTGADDTERQVMGLAPPSQPDAGVSLDALRHGTTTYAHAAVGAVITASLTPAPASLTPGTVITLVPNGPCPAGAQLSLNGLPPVPISRVTGAPLATGDLQADTPVRMAWTGTEFVVLDALPLPCPPGFSVLSRGTCIADSTIGTGNFFAANLACRALSARLCTFSEWSAACHGDPAFFGSVLQAEWVDHAANSTNSAKYLGYGDDGSSVIGGAGCAFGGWAQSDTGTHAIRCCSDR